ncbi:HD domain-containing protein [uncultured Clostridium sp.]|uniref:HD domain-containing protein n=1 Tax=uncultured Clostridium sp. TaxID=59620 RepID=UPI002637CC71|nr:HD domain-containing protein [uncultured Clostridium sp.]
MDKDLVIENTINFIKSEFCDEGSGHDWLHIDRVYKNTCYILEREEGADEFIVKITALLHDVDDWKFSSENKTDTSRIEKFLVAQEVSDDDIFKITDIIKTLSFKGGVVDSTQTSLEGMIVQDADRLDSIGAIGIARAFTYGGYKNNLIYDPEVKAMDFKSLDDVKKKNTTVNHFYEKLLKLKDLMNTDTAKILANERHNFMVSFLEMFYSEWNLGE